jgi:hypothetical protein
MAGTYVLYYPPTTSHPYLVVMFLADATPHTTRFGSEEEAEAFIEQSAPERNAPRWPWPRSTKEAD